MRRTVQPLEEPYRSRAIPPGGMRYWSWLFADEAAREPLLGIYALTAEWRALTDVATERSVAEVKLAWWRDELRRLCAGSAAHPITRYLQAMPRADAAAFAPLEYCIEAVRAEVSGVPLELAAELLPHADALYGTPLRAAARLSGGGEDSALTACTTALAAADYASRAVLDYGRESRAGRVPFPVEDLLAAGIDNADLAAADAPPRLETYLREQRRQAAGNFAAALAALPDGGRQALRHLAVLASLGLRYLNAGRNPSSADFRLADLYNAWNAARRAAAAR